MAVTHELDFLSPLVTYLFLFEGTGSEKGGLVDVELFGRFGSFSLFNNFLLPTPAILIRPKPIKIIIAGSELSLYGIKIIDA